MKLILLLIIIIILPTICIADLDLTLPENITTVIIIESKRTPKEIITIVSVSSIIVVIAIGIIASILHSLLDDVNNSLDDVNNLLDNLDDIGERI